jgi:hypothetical protein
MRDRTIAHALKALAATIVTLLVIFLAAVAIGILGPGAILIPLLFLFGTR